MQAFINYYYQLFESNRAALGTLYQETSMLTFEGQKFMGAANIMTKMGSLAFGACKVHLSSRDFQPSVSGGIMVFVTGNIQVRRAPRVPPVLQAMLPRAHCCAAWCAPVVNGGEAGQAVCSGGGTG